MLTNLAAKGQVKVKIGNLLLLELSDIIRVSDLQTNLFNANGIDG